eukprot:1901874-Rhodomonas_salina.2
MATLHLNFSACFAHLFAEGIRVTYTSSPPIPKPPDIHDARWRYPARKDPGTVTRSSRQRALRRTDDDKRAKADDAYA